MLLRVWMIALCLFAPRLAWADRWAMVVGVSDYDDETVPDVPRARADAEAVRDWLVSVGGVPPDHLWLLQSGGVPTAADADAGQPLAATRSNMLDVLAQRIGGQATPEDTVFVYFAGQSTMGPDGTATLLPSDARLALSGDTGVSLARVVGSIPGGPVLWLDTSPSGRGSALPEAAPATAYDAIARQGLVWAATSPDRIADEADGAPYGAFTDALLRALRSTDASVDRSWVKIGQDLRGHPAPWGRSLLPAGARFADVEQAVRSHPRVVPQSGHGSRIEAVAWHPTRPWLASADATGIVQITDVERQEIRLRYPAGRRGVRSLAFSVDGEQLFAVGTDGVARAWTSADGALQWTRGFTAFQALTSLTVHEDLVVVGTQQGRVVTLDAATGKRAATWRVGPSRTNLRSSATEDVAWSPSGTSVATAAANGELSLWWRRPSGRTGKRMRRQPLQRVGAPVRSVVWTAEDQLVAGSSDGVVQAYQLGRGTWSTLESNGFSIDQVAARPGSNEIAVAADTVRLWPSGSDAPRLVLETGTRATAVAFSVDGQQLVTGHSDGQLRLWNVDTGAELGTLPGRPSAVQHIATGPNQRVAVVGAAGATVWDLGRGRPLRALPVDGVQNDAAFTEDGTLVLGGDDGIVRWWNPDTGAVDQQWSTNAAIRAIDANDTVVVASSRDRVHVLGGDADLRAEWSVTGTVDDLALCGADGALVVSAADQVRTYDQLTGKPRARARSGRSSTCSPDGTRVAVGRSGGAVGVLHADTLARVQNGRVGARGVLLDPMGTLVGARRVSGVAWHPTEQWILLGAEGATTRVWNAETGSLEVDLDTFGSRTVAFVPEGELVVTGGADGTIQLWDQTRGNLLATAVSLDDDWLVWSPDGLFDGSPAGQRTLFRWRIGETLHPPSKFNRGFYRPGLLAELARGERPRAQRDIASLRPPPKVRIVSPSNGDRLARGFVDVGVRIDDTGGGISEPRLYLNGHRVGGTRGLEQVVGMGEDDAPDAVFRVALMEGENFLRATAFNEDGSWEALGDEITITWEADPADLPRLHVIAVGIDAYQNQRLNLNFARDDAEAVAEFFTPGLFGEIVTHVLVDDQASLGSIEAVFEQVARQAAPRDALLVYMAGHGVMSGETFYFLPWDVQVGSDDEVAQTALSQAALGSALAEIPAAKQLVVLDACHSGGAMQGLAQALATRSSPGMIRAQQRLADSTGAFLIAASTEAQVANEIPELGHGVLTYAILDGLGDDGLPAANRDLDGNVTVGGLIQYVSQMVPRLTDRYHRQRQEVVQSASGQDFPLVTP